jgi:hypothetical protein
MMFLFVNAEQLAFFSHCVVECNINWMMTKVMSRILFLPIITLWLYSINLLAVVVDAFVPRCIQQQQPPIASTPHSVPHCIRRAETAIAATATTTTTPHNDDDSEKKNDDEDAVVTCTNLDNDPIPVSSSSSSSLSSTFNPFNYDATVTRSNSPWTTMTSNNDRSNSKNIISLRATRMKQITNAMLRVVPDHDKIVTILQDNQDFILEPLDDDMAVQDVDSIYLSCRNRTERYRTFQQSMHQRLTSVQDRAVRQVVTALLDFILSHE